MTILRCVKGTCVALGLRSYTKVFMEQTTRLSSASNDFSPPTPPSSKGFSVYQDIDLSEVGSGALDRNTDPDAVFFVSGGSRGIGLQFVIELVKRTKGSIVTGCRNYSGASGLNDFIQSLTPEDRSRVYVIEMDLEKQESIEEAASYVQEKFNRVDLLLNVAGLLGDGVSTSGPERSISKLNRDWVEKTLAVNVIGPMMLSKEIAPLMKTKREKDRSISVIASLSARVGSISDNELGGWYSYRFSKAALNQATRTLAHELKRQGTWAISLHPGTTDTDLSKPFQKNVAEGRLFPVDFTVKQLLLVIESMEAEHSGGLYDWAGKAIPF